MNWEIPDVQDGFRKGRGTRDQIANIYWVIEKARDFQKNIYFSLIDSTKDFDCGSQQTVENFEKDGNARYIICLLRDLYVSQETTARTGHGTNDWFKKLGKEYDKAIYCHPAYLTYMQSTSCEMLGWMKHRLESRFWEEILITSFMQMIPPLWQKVKKN